MERKIITNIVGARLERIYFTPSENKETEGIHNLLLNFDNGDSITIRTADRNILLFVESGKWEMVPAEPEVDDPGTKMQDLAPALKEIADEDIPPMPKCKEPAQPLIV